MTRSLRIDASAGVAGDMLLGALLDAGADLAAVQRAIEAVLPGSVAITVTPAVRAGMRATKAEVEVLVDDPPHRTWASIRSMIQQAEIAGAVRDRALAAFGRLAEAEGRVHGVPADTVHFHEVGALDSIADVVGVCAALADLGITSVSVGPVAVGSGEIRAEHGRIPVPVPAVSELARGFVLRSGGVGELTTPTGMALLASLTAGSSELPDLVIDGVGVGAGTKDFSDHANVTRVLIGAPDGRAARVGSTEAVVIEANVDDLDPRLWPDVLAALMRAGADDAWLTPILMKKGRPAHTLHVLADDHRAEAMHAVIFSTTSTIGVRESRWTKFALARMFVRVEVDGGGVAIKIAHLDDVITQVSAEFDDVAALAARTGRSQRQVMQAAMAAAAAAGWRIGTKVPFEGRTNRSESLRK